VDGWTDFNERMAAMATIDKVDVSGKIDEIKRYMPETYKHIQAKAAEGVPAYRLVRQGLLGEPNCFYAFEGGRVMGTPFSTGPIPDQVKALMVEFGCAFVCIFQAKEVVKS
jgi:hypothetical protein